MTIQENCRCELHHCRPSTWIGSRFRVFQPVKIHKGFHEVCTVLHLEAPACPGDLKTSKIDGVAFIAQHHHIRQIQIGLHVFTIAHEMFLWSRAHHVIRVTQEDRTI